MRHLITDRGAQEAESPILNRNHDPAHPRDLIAGYRALADDVRRFIARPSGEHLAAIETRMAALLVAHDAEAVAGLAEAFEANPRRFQRPRARGVPELVKVDQFTDGDDEGDEAA